MLLFTICYISGIAVLLLYLMKYINIPLWSAMVIYTILIGGSVLGCLYINNNFTQDDPDTILNDGEDELYNV